MKRLLSYFLIVFSLLILSSPSKSNDQSNVYFPENYWNAVEEDLRALEGWQEIKASASSISKVSIDNIDFSGFPLIRVTVTVYDAEGNPIPDLAPEIFSFWEEHELSGSKRIYPVIKQLKEETSNLDIVFCIDTTGSMGWIIDSVKTNILDFLNTLTTNKIDFRVAGISFGDEVPYRELKPFTSDAADFQGWVSSLAATGGDDWPENPLDCIISASKLPFRADAQKVIVLITDAPAHVAGDGGDSSTSATFGAAANAVSSVDGLKLYYSSPESQYGVLGSSLGWPFDNTVLVSTLGTRLTVKYIASYETPFTTKDGRYRTVTVKAETAVARDKYKPISSGTLTGTVMNIDSPPSPLKDIKITIYNSDFKASTYTDADGKYTITNIPEGTYTVETFHVDRKKQTKEVKIVDKETTVADFNLGLATVDDLKRTKLNIITELTNWTAAGGLIAPFADESARAKEWVDSIVDTGSGIPDAQKEALKREILAEQSVLKSTEYATSDVKILAAGIAGTIWNVLEALDVFKSVNKTIKSLISRLSAYKDSFLIGSIVTKVINLTAKLNEKVMSLISSAVSAVLDIITNILNFFAAGSPIIDTISSIIKDVLGLFTKEGGGSSTLEKITNAVYDKLGRELVVPIYGEIVDDYLDASLNKAKSITAANESSYNSAVALWTSQMKVMKENYDSKMNIAKTADQTTAVLGAVGGVVGSIRALTDFLEYTGWVPVVGQILLGISKAVQIVDKGIKILQAGVNAFGKAGPAGLHLYQLPGDVNASVGAAYNLNKIASLGTLSYPEIERFNISANAINTLNLTTLEYNILIDQIIAYIEADDYEGLAATNLLDNLFDTDDSFEAAVKNVETIVLAGASDDIKNIPMFDYYFNELVNTGPSNRLDRASMFMNLFMFLLYTGINGTGTDEYLEMKENILAILYATREGITSYDSLLTEMSSLKGTAPASISITKMTLSPSEISTSPEELKLNIQIANPSTVAISDVSVTVTIPDEFTGILKVNGDTTVNIGIVDADSSVEVSFDLSFEGEINGQKIPIYAALSTTDTNVLIPSDRFIIASVVGTDDNNNGIPDWWETKYGIKDIWADDDMDGLKNALEYRFGFNPKNKDTDGDGILDLEEAALYSEDFPYDVDKDNKVTIKDLALVENTRAKKGFSAAFDLLPDGEINDFDLFMLEAFWGSQRR
ncbi:carboxypeptidase regulatory-like domain-containing protein [Persephonella sp.]